MGFPSSDRDGLAAPLSAGDAVRASAPAYFLRPPTGCGFTTVEKYPERSRSSSPDLPAHLPSGAEMSFKRALTLVGGVALAAALAACGSSTSSTTSNTSAAASSAAASSAMSPVMSSPAMSSPSMSSDAMSSDATGTGTSAMSGVAAPASLVGPGGAGCAAAG